MKIQDWQHIHILIQGDFSFEDFKNMIYEKAWTKDCDKLCVVKCNCWKIYEINTEEDYKEIECECWSKILHFV